MATTDPVPSASGRLAGLHRYGAPAPEILADAKRNLTAAHVERAIQKALAAAPPLTDDQRSRLAALLTGGAR